MHLDHEDDKSSREYIVASKKQEVVGEEMKIQAIGMALFLLSSVVVGAFVALPRGDDGTSHLAFNRRHFNLQKSKHVEKEKTIPLSLAKRNKNDTEQKDSFSANLFDLNTFKEKPGTLLIAPFVVLVALDLLANIAVITKRSIEYALTGQYTEWHF